MPGGILGEFLRCRDLEQTWEPGRLSLDPSSYEFPQSDLNQVQSDLDPQYPHQAESYSMRRLTKHMALLGLRGAVHTMLDHVMPCVQLPNSLLWPLEWTSMVLAWVLMLLVHRPLEVC